jgi:putative ABC transport system permease protein
MLAKVRSIPGVAKAAGDVFEIATLLGPNGAALDSSAPGYVTSVLPAPFSYVAQVSGEVPRRSDELELDQATFERAHLHVGDIVRVAGVGRAVRYELVGSFNTPGAGSFGGASVALMTLPQAQVVVGEVGRYDEIDVLASPGVTPAQLRDRLAAALPSTVVARTAAEQTAREESDLTSNLGFVRTFLLIFAYVALFVGGFIIFNTFSITVAQRTRELGLMRAMGASRRQVLTSVVGESLLLGIAGAAVGIVLGLLAAPGLDALFKSLGADLPANGTVLEARTVIVSLVAGVGASVLAGLAPALRATRVPPVAAMREGVAPEAGRIARYSLPISVFVLLAGAALVADGLAGGHGAAMAGIGGLVVFIGTALLSPRFVPALAKALAHLVTWRGVTGRLARENVSRQPGRTAVTSSALMIGLALVTFVSVLAAGGVATIDSVVNSSIRANLIVEGASEASNVGIPAELVPALHDVPGVAAVAPVTFSEANVKGIAGTQLVSGVTGALAGLYRVTWVEGSARLLSSLGAAGTVVTKSFAKSDHLSVGSALSVLTPSGEHLGLVVRGIVTDNGELLKALTVSRSVVQRSFGQSNDGVDFIGYAKGALSVQAAVARLVTKDFPQAKSLTAAQFDKQQANQLDSLLALMYVLLALAVVVSLFGLVNTLVLSIYERTRELGTLRAVGASRRQIRELIRYESVITSLIGAVTGLAVGTLFALVIARSMAGSGFVISVPVATLVVLLVVAGLAGVVAAVPPARRAAHLEVLSALSAE